LSEDADDILAMFFTRIGGTKFSKGGSENPCLMNFVGHWGDSVTVIYVSVAETEN
jgi:hypothetical protein